MYVESAQWDWRHFGYKVTWYMTNNLTRIREYRIVWLEANRLTTYMPNTMK
ncbi:hypothetical protein [Candidatus Hodgkinia cicadicola]|uniref:hypothetical protein n=1 Tax=Candidatus Hodgkinia cicadicola TaxID=573658 RepID=UPI001788DFD1